MLGTVLGDAEVGLRGVVIIYVGVEHVTQTHFTPDDYVIEEFASDRTDDAGGIAILQRRVRREGPDANAKESDVLFELLPQLTAIVSDQVLRCCHPGKCASPLLGDPLRGGVWCDGNPQDPPASVTHDNKDIRRLKLIGGTNRRSIEVIPSSLFPKNAFQPCKADRSA